MMKALKGAEVPVTPCSQKMAQNNNKGSALPYRWRFWTKRRAGSPDLPDSPSSCASTDVPSELSDLSDLDEIQLDEIQTPRRGVRRAPLAANQALVKRWQRALCSHPPVSVDLPLEEGLPHFISDVPEVVLAQIELDIPRTMPGLLRPAEQQRLRRVLQRHAAAAPEVGYCQGLNCMAALLLLVGLEEQEVLTALLSLRAELCPGYHGEGLVGYRRDARVLVDLALRLLPAETQKRLAALEVPLEALAAEHFVALGAASPWPLESVVELWDLLIEEGAPALFASFLAMLELYLPPIGMSEEEPVEVFRAAVVEGVTSDPSAIPHRARQLLPFLSVELIEGLRMKHQLTL